ncbi:MAG: alkaline phosphatase family protein [Methanoregula sp.]
MNKIGEWLKDKWQKLVSVFGKIATDNYAIFVLGLAIIVILVFIIYFGVTPVLVILAPVPNYIYSWVKEFRQKILFKKSGTSVSSNEGPKVLFWILDGCNIPAFLDVAQRNPYLRTLFEEGYFAECVTIFPSITPAAHSTLMTGCYPAKTRVPAFDWVEVKPGNDGSVSKEYIRVMPDFKRYRELPSDKKARDEFFQGLGDAIDLNQKFLSPMVSTIFEVRSDKLYTASIKEWIHRGADSFIGESVTDLIDDLANKKLIEKNTMIGLLTAFYKEASYEYGDLIWGSECSRQLADLMVYWKSGTDTLSHEYGPKSFQVRDQIDEAIIKLADTIRFYKMHSNQPVYVIISADHSQSEVTRFSNLSDDFKRTLGKTYAVAGQEDRANAELMREAHIIMANNDRAAFFYTFGTPEKKDAAGTDILDFLKKRTDVDLIFYKENSTFQAIQVLENGSCSGPEDITTFFMGKEESYPNAVERLEGLMKGDKWGEIVISMKEGYSMNSEFRPSYEGEKILHGDHAGLNSSDSLVPLLFWGPTIKPNIKDGKWKTFRTVDIAPTIASIFKDTHPKTDGQALEEIFVNEK